MNKLYIYLLALLAIFIPVSCEEDDDPSAPEAAFDASATTAEVGEEIQFTNTSENATAFRWSFGDGTTSKEISPKKAYDDSGIYTVSLVSTGEGGSIISSMTITIVPKASFTVENPGALVTLTPIQFTNTSRGATSYEWSFGNAANSTSTEAAPAFTYFTPGTFTVTLKAISPEGESTYSQTITVNAAPAEIYFIEYSDGFIRKLALDGSGTVTDVLDINGKAGVGLAYDEVNGKIFFTDFEVTYEGKVWRANLDGSELEMIADELIEPYGIAVDATGGKVYWVDEWDDNYVGHVYRSDLDGSNIEPVVSLQDAQFRAISLDPENNKMYFYDVYNEQLLSSDLDGSNVTPVVDGVYGYGIVVDTENNKIYFDDQNAGELNVANLDGSNVQTIDDDGSRIYGLAIDNDSNKLYWSGRDSGEIYEANLDGTGLTPLKSALSSPRGIFLRK